MRAFWFDDGDGDHLIHAETGDDMGVLRGSVGPLGESSGIFRRCKTTAPLEELNIEIVQRTGEVPVKLRYR